MSGNPYNIKMPSKHLRATNVLMTYNGDFSREAIKNHLESKGVQVEMVVRNEDGHVHLHVIGGKSEKTCWNPAEYTFEGVEPHIVLQKHEGGKAGLYDYLRSQDSEPLYVSINEDDIDKSIKYRKRNERSKVGVTSMDSALEKLSTCASLEDVEALS